VGIPSRNRRVAVPQDLLHLIQGSPAVNEERCSQFKSARRGAEALPLQKWTAGQPVESLARQPTLVDASIGMRDALHIRYQTGHKLLLQENQQVVGTLGDGELYHALLGKAMG
jgi:glycine betaine/proline transport system ATP-binding protein